MSRYIDAELIPALFDEEYKKTRELIRQGETHLDNLAEGFTEATHVIRKMPTADAVGVVRCKDCVHWTDTSCDSRVTEAHWGECRKPLGDYRYCETAENDYCSYGERKDDGT